MPLWHKEESSICRDSGHQQDRQCRPRMQKAHWQDFLAFKRLVEEGLIDHNAIAVPGHSYDFLAGSHLKGYQFAKTKDFKLSDIFLAIMKKHSLFQVNDRRLIEQISKRINIVLGLNDSEQILCAKEAYSLLELFDWQERQAKFICNAPRVYEFFGYEWRIPLWGGVLMDFWAKVDMVQRFDRKLLKYYYATKFKELKMPANPPQSIISRIANKLRNPWYSQFAKSKRVFSIFTTKLAEAVEHPAIRGFDFIPWNRPLITIRAFNFIAALSQMNEMSDECYKSYEDIDSYWR